MFVYHAMVESFMNPKCSVRKTAMQESLGDIERIVRDDTISPDFKVKFLEMIQDNKELRTEAEGYCESRRSREGYSGVERRSGEGKSELRLEKQIENLRADATNKELVELKYKYFALKSEYSAVITVRPSIESWAGQYLPQLTLLQI